MFKKLKLLAQSYCSRLGLSSAHAAVELLCVRRGGFCSESYLGDRLADGTAEPRSNGRGVPETNRERTNPITSPEKASELPRGPGHK